MGLYTGFALIWILASAPLGDLGAELTGWSRSGIEVGKGVLFVLATAALLAVLLRRWARRLQAAAAREREAAAEIRRAEAIRTTFLSGVSHEIRTPLTSILGFARTIGERGDSLPAHQLRDVGNRLERSSARLEHLMLDLLDVDPLLAGMSAIHRQSTDLALLARRTVSAMELGGRQVEVRGEAVTVAVDVAKIERVLQHLVGNAVRHTDDGAPIVVTVADGDREATIMVEDGGPGLPPELSRERFTPFNQGAGVDTQASPGVGIGLAVVARYVELHDGTVMAEDVATGGTRFVVLLPREAKPTASGREQPPIAN
ncbi:MAG: HAMP domain-containing sensor histidine kinase [Nitriliruptoraceae bacterium]